MTGVIKPPSIATATETSILLYIIIASSLQLAFASGTSFNAFAVARITKSFTDNLFDLSSPKLALICYIKDFFNLIKYLLIPILYLIINFILNLRPKYFLYKELLLVTFSFALLVQSFWLFIGWYPPIRFSYYGFGNLIIFLLILFYALIDNKNLRKLYIGAYSCYFLFLNHWNYPDTIKTNNYLFFSALLFLLLIVFVYKKNHDKLHI